MFKLRGMKQTSVKGEGTGATISSTTKQSSVGSEMATTIATTFSGSSAKCQDKDFQPPNQKPIYFVTTENENTVSKRFASFKFHHSFLPAIT